MKVKNITPTPITVVVSKDEQVLIYPKKEVEVKDCEHLKQLIALGYLQEVEKVHKNKKSEKS